MYVEIKTKRLLLRPLRPEDFPDVRQYIGDPENTRFMLFMQNFTKDETRQFLSEAWAEWQMDQPRLYEFAVMLSGKHIGIGSVSLEEENTAELSWILNNDYWKRGYGVETALALKKFAVDTLCVLRLSAHCDSRNESSRRLMEKIGLKTEGPNGTRTYPKNGETAEELLYTLNLRSSAD